MPPSRQALLASHENAKPLQNTELSPAYGFNVMLVSTMKV